jgi:hypothetical protein
MKKHFIFFFMIIFSSLSSVKATKEGDFFEQELFHSDFVTPVQQNIHSHIAVLLASHTYLDYEKRQGIPITSDEMQELQNIVGLNFEFQKQIYTKEVLRRDSSHWEIKKFKAKFKTSQSLENIQISEELNSFFNGKMLPSKTWSLLKVIKIPNKYFEPNTNI